MIMETLSSLAAVGLAAPPGESVRVLASAPRPPGGLPPVRRRSPPVNASLKPPHFVQSGRIWLKPSPSVPAPDDPVPGRSGDRQVVACPLVTLLQIERDVQ